MVTKKEMLALLEATEFPKNKGRTNILNKGQTYSQSMVLGKVRKMFSSCDGKVCNWGRQRRKEAGSASGAADKQSSVLLL